MQQNKLLLVDCLLAHCNAPTGKRFSNERTKPIFLPHISSATSRFLAYTPKSAQGIVKLYVSWVLAPRQIRVNYTSPKRIYIYNRGLIEFAKANCIETDSVRAVAAANVADCCVLYIEKKRRLLENTMKEKRDWESASRNLEDFRLTQMLSCPARSRPCQKGFSPGRLTGLGLMSGALASRPPSGRLALHGRNFYFCFCACTGPPRNSLFAF